MCKAITAPQKIRVVGPSIYLVGPILNAPDWQSRATRLLLPYANVLNPHPREKDTCEDAHPSAREARRQWEFGEQDRADVIVAWFPIFEQSTGQRMNWEQSAAELGVHIGTRRLVAIGIEPGFPGEEWLRSLCRHHNADHLYEVFPTLEETCAEAIRRLNVLWKAVGWIRT